MDPVTEGRASARAGILVPVLYQQPDKTGKQSGKSGKGERDPAGMFAFEFRHRDVVVNSRRFKHEHQEKRDDKSDRGPFQTPQKQHVRMQFNAFDGLIQWSKAREFLKRKRIRLETPPPVRVGKTA